MKPCIALLHGGGQGSWVWTETAAHLRAGGAQVLLLDVPGCGAKRERAIDGITVDAIAEELLADMRAADMAQAVLVGHSLAGAILPRMAQQAPSQISRLVYLSCTAALPGNTFLDQMGLGLHGAHPDQVGWPVDIMTSSLEDRFRAMFCNDMPGDEADAFLARLGADNWPPDVFERTDWRYGHLRETASSYIVCERDQSLPPDWQRRFAERLHCTRLASIDAGHQAMNTQAGRLAELLLAQA